jgi:Putative Flp pilus-assembly TadE/G-like
LPLLALVVVALIAAGVLVLWLGLATSVQTKAQTAADAAALAGEQELVTELQIPRFGPNGQPEAAYYVPSQVCQKAKEYATANDGYMSCPRDIEFLPGSGLFGTDVRVTVHSQQTLPNGSGNPGKGGTAQARASTDPFSQSSPSIDSTTLSCDASLVSGTPFNPPAPHPGPGFFAETGTNYDVGCEPKLAGKLQALAKAKGLHLVGVLGYQPGGPGSNDPTGTNATVTNPTGTNAIGATGAGAAGVGSALLGTTSTGTTGALDTVAAAHGCGAASQTDGWPEPPQKPITDADLKSFGLSRPFPGHPDEIELDGSVGCIQSPSGSAAAGSVGFGNSNVHLVPLSGGPSGDLFAGLSGGITSADISQKQLGCILYSVDIQLHVSQEVMLATFMAAWTESSMSDITSYTPGQGESLGLFQQQSDDGWGTPAEETNPVLATEMFLLGTGPGTPFYDGNGGDEGAIQEAADHPSYTPWYLTEQVQHSAFLDGSNYLKMLPTAQTMITNIQSGGCANA